MSTPLVPTSPNDLVLCARTPDALTKAPVGGWSTIRAVSAERLGGIRDDAL